MGFFSDLFGTGGAATDAANAKIAGLRAGQAYADPLFAQGRTDISSGYGKAQDVWNPLYNIGQGGASAYADITGAAGAAGQDRARALFQTDPGYEFARDEALKATERATGTGGFQSSGNVLTALQDRASGLASQQYKDYVSRLQPFLGYSATTAAGLGSAYTGEGTALAKSLQDQAMLGYGTEAGVGSATGAGILGEAQAEQSALGNALTLGSKLLGFAFPGGLGLPGGGSLTGFAKSFG